MINKVLHLKFKCIVLSCFVQKSTEHICFDLLLNFPPNMLIRLGNLSWFVTEALGGNGLRSAFQGHLSSNLCCLSVIVIISLNGLPDQSVDFPQKSTLLGKTCTYLLCD